MSKVYVLTHYEEDSPSKPEYSNTVIQHSYYAIDSIFEYREAVIKRLREIIKEWRKKILCQQDGTKLPEPSGKDR